jgi:hypothetical protein
MCQKCPPIREFNRRAAERERNPDARDRQHRKIRSCACSTFAPTAPLRNTPLVAGSHVPARSPTQPTWFGGADIPSPSQGRIAVNGRPNHKE